MKIFCLSLLLRVFCAEPRFVPLLRQNTPLKSVHQIKRHYALVEKAFGLGRTDVLYENWNYSIFMYLDRGEAIAFAKAAIDSGYKRGGWFWGGRVKVPYICFYGIVVADRYKGMGVCKGLFVEIVDYLKKELRLPEDTVLALHLSAQDPMMYIAARVYYKLGFRRGTFSRAGPEIFQTNIDEFLERSNDLYEIADDPTISTTEGSFLALYCELRDFGVCREPPAGWMEKGKALMGILRERQAAEGHERGV